MAEKQTGPEQEGFYDILQNGAGDLLISIRARAGEPDHPQIVYDGGKHGLLYRQHGFSITLDFIHPDARAPLAKAESVLIVEFEGGEIISSRAFYNCKNLPESIIFTSARTIGNEAFSQTNITFVELTNSIVSLGVSESGDSNTAFMNNVNLLGARVYSEIALKAVINNTGIVKGLVDNNSYIYTNMEFYNEIERLCTGSSAKDYLEYNIIVEDRFELFDTNNNPRGVYTNLQEAINNAENNYTILIKGNYVLTTTIEINKPVNIVAGVSSNSSSTLVTLSRHESLTDYAFIISSNGVVIGREFNLRGYNTLPLHLVGNGVESLSLIYVDRGELTLGNQLEVYNNHSNLGAVVRLSPNGGEVNVEGGKYYDNVVSGSGVETANGGVFYLDDESKLNITGGEFYNNSAVRGGVIYSQAQSIINIDAGANLEVKMYNNSATNGGVLYIASTILDEEYANYIGNASIYSNLLTNISSNGGGVYIANGMLSIGNEAHIYSNYAVNGGGVYVGNGILVIYDGIVGGSATGNRAVNGGGVYIADNGVIRLSSSDAEVSYNSATNGANIYFASTYNVPGKVSVLASGSIIGGNKTSVTSNAPSNISSLKGGGIFIKSGNLEIKDEVIITSNIAGFGGGIYIEEGVLTLRNNRNTSNSYGIVSNSALNGGGIYVKNGRVDVIASAVLTNSATQNGGGIYLEDGEVKIYDNSRNSSVISGNTSTLNGGGIYVKGGELNVYVVSGNISQISSNSAYDGAGIYLGGGEANLRGIEITNNTARNNGGGIYTYNINQNNSYSYELYDNVNISNNTALNGGGLYVNSILDIIEATITGNTVGLQGTDTQNGFGGAVYVGGSAVLTLEKANISDNLSTHTASGNISTTSSIEGITYNNFAGIYLSSSVSRTLRISNNSTIRNIIYLVQDATIYITDRATNDMKDENDYSIPAVLRYSRGDDDKS